MSYAFDYPSGSVIEPEPPSHAFGCEFPTATVEAVAMCRDLGFRELTAADVDFERTSTSHKKVDLANGEYRRYHRGTIESAGDAGVDCFLIQSGFLILLHPPNSEHVVSERLGDVPRGYEADPNLRIRPNWQPGMSAALPRR